MNPIKIYTATIEQELATEVLSYHNNCGVNFDITDNEQILQFEITPKNKYSMSQNELDEIKDIAVKRLGHNVFADTTLQESVVKLLKARHLKLATAESCTSGLISSKITQISGASEVFHYGLSAYSNEIKIKSLNVQQSIIDKYGAVSSQTAASMAIGAMRAGDADIGLSITGVAGPNMSEGKPVGLIYIGLCDKAGLWVLKLELNGDKYGREEIRQRAANIALDFVRRYLSFENFGCDLYRGDDSHCITTEQLTRFSIDISIEYPLISKTSKNNTDKIQNKFTSVFPSLKDGVLGFLRKLTAWILTICALIFTIKTVLFFATEHDELSLNKAVVAEYNKQLENNNKYHINNDGIFEMFSSLHQQNNDFLGWISNGNSDINSAVMKSSQDDYYLNHNFNNKVSNYGLISIDSNCIINDSVNSKNIILYGKNNANGFAFGNLDKYLDLTYYKSNIYIKFDTLNTKNEYVIFAVAKIDKNNDFVINKANFTDNPELFQYLDDINKNSLYYANIITNHENDFLTLVTEYSETETLAVFARKLMKNEQIDNIIITTPSK